MAGENTTIRIENFGIEQDGSHEGVRVSRSSENLIDRLGHEVFRHDCLDRKLKRHHVTGNCSADLHKSARLPETGIGFSGAVGIGLLQTSGQMIALSGPVGALLSFLFAGLTIFAVMRSLAEMASVRPVAGAIMDYPSVFVDEALGFAVGWMYWYELQIWHIFASPC